MIPARLQIHFVWKLDFNFNFNLKLTKCTNYELNIEISLFSERPIKFTCRYAMVDGAADGDRFTKWQIEFCDAYNVHFESTLQNIWNLINVSIMFLNNGIAIFLVCFRWFEPCNFYKYILTNCLKFISVIYEPNYSFQWFSWCCIFEHINAE